jgi:hypothetical protein
MHAVALLLTARPHSLHAISAMIISTHDLEAS